MPTHPGMQPHPSYGGFSSGGGPPRSPYYGPQYGGHPNQPYSQYPPYPYHPQYGPPPTHYMNQRPPHPSGPPMHYPDHNSPSHQSQMIDGGNPYGTSVGQGPPTSQLQQPPLQQQQQQQPPLQSMPSVQQQQQQPQLLQGTPSQQIPSPQQGPPTPQQPPSATANNASNSQTLAVTATEGDDNKSIF